MKYSLKQSGFTAVELLITLFIAAAFIVAGYQLFNIVVKDGGSARAESRAGNVAYDYMRRYSPDATNPCSAQTPLTAAPISVDGLSQATISVAISCPDYSTTSLSKIDVTVHYNSPQQTVKYSSFINGISPASPDVIDGLVAWWKFNGNTNSSIGTSNGTISGDVTPTTGQNGQINSAYNFTTTCCKYILTSAVPSLPSTMTLSAWVYPTALPAERAAIIVNSPPAGSSSYFLSLNSDGSAQTYWFGASSAGYHSSGASTVATNQWTLITAVWNGTQAKLYTNGVLRTTVSSTSVGASSTSISIGAQNTDSSRQFVGRLDDLRIFNRALSDAEVTSLYTNGAK